MHGKMRITLIVIAVSLIITICIWVVIIIANSGDTIYAPGFTEDHFQHISIGMSMDEVENKLGKPLVKYGYDLVWSYSDMNPGGGGRYKNREVIFDKHHRVSRIVSNVHVHDE